MEVRNELGIKVLKGVSWMALFNFSTQGISWLATIYIARLLSPADYGLMGIATIFTGYIDMLVDLGLGAAIIQSKNLTEKVISSLFWFMAGLGFIVSLACFPLSWITANIMSEPKVIPIIQIMAVAFLFSSLKVVPSSLLRRNIDFKSIGISDSIGAILSIALIIILAIKGYGVWALVAGMISRSFFTMILYFVLAKWRPAFYCNLKEAKYFINYGLQLTLGRTFFYIQGKAGTFFTGRVWSATNLGFYTFALELSQMPIDKIVPLINQVCFPALSKLQNDKEAFATLYLQTIKLTALILFPLLIGGFCLGDLMIGVLLGEKWEPIIPIFKYLCLSQIFLGLNSINGVAQPAAGKPLRTTIFQIICAVMMSVGFFIAVKVDFFAIIYPHLVIGSILYLGYIFYSLHVFGIKLITYFDYLKSILFASLIMFLTISGARMFTDFNCSSLVNLIITLLCGTITYLVTIFFLERELAYRILVNIRKRLNFNWLTGN